MDYSGKVFLTGSTGFIGRILVEKLLKRGCTVRALTRQPKESRDGVEYVVGDITDIESLRRGMDGCRYVIHLAAYAKSWSRDRSLFDRVNIEGTRNVYAVAGKYGVERIVWTSTVVTLGPTPQGVVGDEAMPRTTERFYTDYERTKTLMERETLSKWVPEGLPVVVVNPTRVFGPGLLSESNTVPQLIAVHRRGLMPVLFNLGKNVGNYVLVDDVAEGHLLAMERGRVGERYLLGGDNASLKELFQTIDRIDGVKRFQIPIFWFLPMVVAYAAEARANLLGLYPPFTPDWLRTFLADWAFSCDKAKRELGYEWTPFEEGMRRTCRWLDDGIPADDYKAGVSWGAAKPRIKKPDDS